MINHDPGLTTHAFTPDNLIAGDTQLISESIILITGQNLARGALLGRITASGKYTLSLSAAADGSEVPRAILAQDTDATAVDKTTVAYIKGEFNENAIVFGTGHDIANSKDGLRGIGLYLKGAIQR